jgi:hypothetical protein
MTHPEQIDGHEKSTTNNDSIRHYFANRSVLVTGIRCRLSCSSDRVAYSRGGVQSSAIISEYQLGHFAFLMSLAFFCLGAGSLFLARTLWIDLRTKIGRIDGWWLILLGTAYIGAGIFAPDPTSIVESRLHGLFGIIVTSARRSFSPY